MSEDMTTGQALPGAPLPPVPSATVGDVAARRLFVLATYQHLLGAMVAFVLLEAIYFRTGVAEVVAGALLSVPWLLVLGGFIVVGMLARNFAASPRSRGLQYAGLAGYVVAESIIFIPMLYVADSFAPGTIARAATMTLLGFAGLTAVVFTSREDFSVLSGLLKFGGVLALVTIVGALLFGVGLGTWFSVAMIGLAGVAILVDTSKVLHHYPDDAHVAASLELFASVALLFWYVLRLFMSRR